jgi:hypothetical protein
MPLVGYSERDFVDLVVCLDALDDVHYGRQPLSPAMSFAFGRALLPDGRLVGLGSGSDSRKKAGSTPTLSRTASSFSTRGSTLLLVEVLVHPTNVLGPCRRFPANFG